MKKSSKGLGIYLFIFLLIILAATAFQFFGNGGNQITKDEVSFSDFIRNVDQGKVKEISIDDTKITGKLSDTEYIYAYASSLSELTIYNDAVLKPLVIEGKLTETNESPGKGEWILNALPTVLMIGSIIFLFWFITSQGGNGKAFAFGKNKAKMVKDGKDVTFDDVAGLDEEKQELEEVVDFLKSPKKYKDLGARIPKGILLVGPPGTGKTYLSKATAGEAGVPFFTISGSDFVEMFVGVGASRVRELFGEAKKNNPCIIFIDEIDAVGRKRGAGIGGGHDEREQTLNQLLVEMDGFGENSGVIILAATNRPDILDPALLRPGRFDRQVVIGIPDIKGREEIFKIHSKNKPLADEVSPKILARRTPGFTPADIENLLNEAALITARRDGRYIRMDEIEEAITKVIAGPEKKSRVISEKERKLTAYHEAGHAVIAKILPTCDPVHQVTIIPRGRAGGFTMTLPEEDKSYITKSAMKEQIVELLAGRVAESIMLDDISTGASNDIQRATDIARDMVTKYGFSEKVGTVNYADSEEIFLGNDFSSKKNYSEEMAKEIDEEIKRIVADSYATAEKLLAKNKEKLINVAEGLLLVETLDGQQFERLFDEEITPDGLAKEVEDKTAEIEKQNVKEARERREIQEREEAEMAEAESANEKPRVVRAKTAAKTSKATTKTTKTAAKTSKATSKATKTTAKTSKATSKATKTSKTSANTTKKTTDKADNKADKKQEEK